MCHKYPSIWHIIQLGLLWTVKMQLLRWNCSGNCALLKSYKLGSQKHTHTHLHMHACKSKLRSTRTVHTQYSSACWHFATTRSVMLAARGYYSCLPAQDAWVQDKHTQIQEVCLHHRKTWCSLFLWLQLSTSSSSSSFSLAVFSSMTRTASTHTSPSSSSWTCLSGHPQTDMTPANLQSVSDQLVGQSSQHISQLICESDASLLAFQLDGQPVNQSSRQLVIEAALQSDMQTVSCMTCTNAALCHHFLLSDSATDYFIAATEQRHYPTVVLAFKGNCSYISAWGYLKVIAQSYY